MTARVLVIGGGLAGLCAAYFLRQQGREITLVERRAGPGRETSFANGALLTPSMPEPWNAPGCWRTLLRSVGKSDAPMQLRLQALPSLLRWGTMFLRNSSPQRFRQSVLANLRLSQFSLEIMESVRRHSGIEYGRSTRGTLRLFRDESSFRAAVAATQQLSSFGLTARALTTTETMELEPALQPIGSRLKGALHYEADEVGDAHLFCEALASHLQGAGVELQFGREVTGLEVRAGKVAAAIVNGVPMRADDYLMAAGSYSTPLLRLAGVRLPVRPVKGYSITFDAPSAPVSLRIPVIDDHLHAGVVPLGTSIRVVGTAEFAGYDLTLRRKRLANLYALLREILPEVPFNPEATNPWCGLRPVSADGVPIIGATVFENLYLNTGHGHLGWTMAVGSGRLVAELVCQRTPALDPSPYALERFGALAG